MDPQGLFSDDVIEELLRDAGLQEVIDRESADAAREAKLERRRIRKELRQKQATSFDFEKLNLFRND